MSTFKLLRVEFVKIKRSAIFIFLFIPPILVVVSGISSIGNYLTQEYTNAWTAMFIQSALLFGYYLLPFSIVIICVLLLNIETKNNGMLKMFSIPISRTNLYLSKFIVILVLLSLEILIFFISFIIFGFMMINIKNINENISISYMLIWSLKLFISMLPAVSCIWMIATISKKTIVSIGLNILMIISSIFIANTPLWIIYPYCYSGYLVSKALHTVSPNLVYNNLTIIHFIVFATIIFLITQFISIKAFKKQIL